MEGAGPGDPSGDDSSSFSDKIGKQPWILEIHLDLFIRAKTAGLAAGESAAFHATFTITIAIAIPLPISITIHMKTPYFFRFLKIFYLISRGPSTGGRSAWGDRSMGSSKLVKRGSRFWVSRSSTATSSASLRVIYLNTLSSYLSRRSISATRFPPPR